MSTFVIYWTGSYVSILQIATQAKLDIIPQAYINCSYSR